MSPEIAPKGRALETLIFISASPRALLVARGARRGPCRWKPESNDTGLMMADSAVETAINEYAPLAAAGVEPRGSSNALV